MKLFIMALALFSMNAMAQSSVKKTFDGKTGVCKEMADVGTRSFKLKVLSQVIVDDKRQLEIEILFYKCAEVDGGYRFLRSSKDEALAHFILLPDGSVGEAYNKLSSVNLSATYPYGHELETKALSFGLGDRSVVTLSVDSSLKKIYVDATSVADITTPIGDLPGVRGHFGGFVLNF